MASRAPAAVARRHLLGCAAALAFASACAAEAPRTEERDGAGCAAILDLAVDGIVYPPGTAPGPGVALPPGTDHFRIRFAGPDAPPPGHCAYRLDGVDGAWRDAGLQRATSYTNVGPGDYLFRLRALDGGMGAAEARLPVHIAALPTQTVWFKLACVFAAVLPAVLLYRYRVRYLTGRLAERLQVRTAERERIARTLHDTFLQTVQGLVLRVDAVAATLPPEDRARRQLEHVLDDASQAIGEGRDQLQELRAGDAVVLEDALADAVARMRATRTAIAVELRVEGAHRSLHPAVSAEIADIGREALRNAFAHSGAAQVRVVLDYGRRALTLCVADDGAGLDPQVRDAGGRAGHWGLVGMRERAERIGAELRLDSAPGRGTTVTLTVPAGRTYAG